MKMKKLSFVFLLFIFSALSICAQNVIIDLGSGSKREVPVKGEAIDDGGNIMRSPALNPFQVFICGKQLTVDFLYPMSNVTITVVNVLTNKVVFCEVCDMPGCVAIDLSTEGVGEYRVNFTLPSTYLWGDFSIE